MGIEGFRASLGDAAPPRGLSPALRALWHAGRGDWDAAHSVVQDESDADCAWVHAHLHRQEGDPGNAAYWYRRAGRPVAQGSIEGEWREIAAVLIERLQGQDPRANGAGDEHGGSA